jgi:hypothetical protein
MRNDGLSGLISRKVVDRIALGVFFVFLILFLTILLTDQSPRKITATGTTVSSSLQVVRGPSGIEHETQTTEKITNDIVPPIWQSLLGAHQTTFLICAAALLAAYLLAAISQRILLGRYAIGIGPLTVPELITPDQVEEPLKTALATTDKMAPPEPASTPEADTEVAQGEKSKVPSGPHPEPQPAWADVSDPNLALAGWRIDVEKELRRIATEFHLPGRDQRILRSIVSSLSEREIIPYAMANSLQDLLTIANQGVHGAAVDRGVINILQTEGMNLLTYLKDIRG